MKNNNIVSCTSESVGIGHPDKIADQIADGIVDVVIKNGKYEQVSCEVLVTKNLVVVAGEFFVNEKINIKEIVLKILKKLKYKTDEFEIIIKAQVQSKNIRNAVVKKQILGGDQGVVFGFACKETKEYLPLSFVIARDLVREAEKLINNNTFKWAKYDMKSLITIHRNNLNEVTINNLVFSIQHDETIKQNKLIEKIEKHVIEKIIKDKYGLNLDIKNKYINSSGEFIVGGLDADSGVTNRKLMIDTYGSACRHGGGGLSGKDLSKVDRLGSYFARWITKNLVAAGIADLIEIKLIYFLGCSKAIEYSITKIENKKFEENKIIQCIKSLFPQNINEIIDLFLKDKINFCDLAARGHFGRTDINLIWEKINKIKEVKQWFLKNPN